MKRLFFLLACTLTLSAQAIEYRTVETTTVLYDAGGREVARVVGGFDWQSEPAKALVDEAIGANAS